SWTWSYAVLDAELLERGMQRCCDYRLVKHLAAAASGLPLISYDESQKILSVPLGAELPWLYERAVVLESGLAPVSKTHGRVEYAAVSFEIASLIWSALIS